MSRRRLPLFVARRRARRRAGSIPPATAATAPAGQRRRARDLPAARRVHLRALDRPTGRRRIDLDRFVVRRCPACQPLARRWGVESPWWASGCRFAAGAFGQCGTAAPRRRHGRSARDRTRDTSSHVPIETREIPVAGSDAGMWASSSSIIAARQGCCASPRRVLTIGTRSRRVHEMGVWDRMRPQRRDRIARPFRIELAHRRHAAPQLAPANEHERQLSVLRGGPGIMVAGLPGRGFACGPRPRTEP